jgi:hypothetical protein
MFFDLINYSGATEQFRLDNLNTAVESLLKQIDSIVTYYMGISFTTKDGVFIITDSLQMLAPILENGKSTWDSAVTKNTEIYTKVMEEPMKLGWNTYYGLFWIICDGIGFFSSIYFEDYEALFVLTGDLYYRIVGITEYMTYPDLVPTQPTNPAIPTPIIPKIPTIPTDPAIPAIPTIPTDPAITVDPIIPAANLKNIEVIATPGQKLFMQASEFVDKFMRKSKAYHSN